MVTKEAHSNDDHLDSERIVLRRWVLTKRGAMYSGSLVLSEEALAGVDKSMFD